MYPIVTLLINGEFKGAGNGRDTKGIINPATLESLGKLPVATESDLCDVVKAAADAFATWRKTSPTDRSAILRNTARLLRERSAQIAENITLDNGKPVNEALAEVLNSAEHLEWAAEECRRIYGRVVPARFNELTQLVVREPVGVCAAFTPWNFPMSQAVKKVAASLGSGCSLILKGPEESPSGVMALAIALVDAGLPKGVFNLVWGIPAQISEYLIKHPVVRKISFTGSVPVGKQLAALAGAHMKRTSMELGGHSPVIVCGDADVERAATLLARYKIRNAGQACVSPTRFFVDAAVHDQFVAKFVAEIESAKIGNGLSSDVQMGPLIHERRVAVMDEFVQDAIKKGADIATGGTRLDLGGYFFAPTVLTGVPHDAKVMIEEPFGPIAPVVKFTSIDGAICLANSLPFGLAAYVFTTSIKNSSKLANELEAGMVNINHSGMAYPELPFGGIKDSGYGSEGGVETFDAYLSVKMITQLA